MSDAPDVALAKLETALEPPSDLLLQSAMDRIADRAAFMGVIGALRDALARERAGKAALLEAAREALKVHDHVNEHAAMEGNALYIANVLRAAIAAAEKEAP